MKHKKSMYSCFLGFLVLALCTPGISAEKTVQSQWAATPPTIDGSNIPDWEGGTMTLYKKTQVEYAFRNDADNLYVIFIFNEPTREYLSTVQQTGITLWLNTDGKKKKNYGIKFAIQTVTADNYIQIVEEMLGEPMPEEKKQQIKAQETYQIFHNEVIDKGGEVPELVSGPAAPAFNTTAGREKVIYEFKVPLKRDDANPVGIGIQPGETLTIGFGWGGTTKEMRQAKLTNSTARGAAGRSGNATGTLTGEQRVSGSGLGSASQFSSLGKSLRAATYIFWADVQLADKQ